MSAEVSRLHSEERRMWLRVSPGHAISEQWPQGAASKLYARWWDTPSLAAREQVALQIEKRLEDLEGPSRGRRRRCGTRPRRRGRRWPTG